MKKTTKKENLLNYVKDACIEHAKENGENIVFSTHRDFKKYINKVFYNEMLKYNKMYENKKVSRYNLFIDWVMGLCFISPMVEDLTPFTRFKVDYLSQEKDVLNKLISYYYISNNEFFNKLINE